MQILYELVHLLDDSLVLDVPPRLLKLYNILRQHPALTAQDAATLYLGDTTRMNYFHTIKNDLKKALIVKLMVNPTISFNKNKTIIEDCYKAYASYKLMLLNNHRKVGIEIAKTLIKTLHDIEDYALLYSVADNLLIHYSIIDYNRKKQIEYRALMLEALENLKDYALIKEHYSRIMSLCNIRESYSNELVQDCIHTVKLISPLIRPNRHNLNKFIYIMIICRYAIVYDYENVVKYCNVALDSFPEKHLSIRSLRFMFLHNQVSALTSLGRLEEAKEIAKESLQIVQKGNFNWHLILLKRIIICLHAGDYQEAYQLYKAHTKKKCLYPIITEYWNIIKGYLYFLIQVGLIEAYNQERFYIGKFINEMPIYSKDKAGNNVNILIIQILVQMKRGQFVKIIDRVDSLREYARLYTRNEETKRANIFIKMLIKVESARFNKIRTKAITLTLLKKLEATPLRVGQNLAVEIIPYEVLWEEILLMLDNKFRAITSKKRISKFKE